MAGFPGPSGGRTLDWQFLQCFGERVAGEDIQDGEGADGKREQKRNDAKNKTERRRRLSEGGGRGGGATAVAAPTSTSCSGVARISSLPGVAVRTAAQGSAPLGALPWGLSRAARRRRLSASLDRAAHAPHPPGTHPNGHESGWGSIGEVLG